MAAEIETFEEFWLLKKGETPSTYFTSNASRVYDSKSSDIKKIQSISPRIQKILPKLCRVLKFMIIRINEEDDEFKWDPRDYGIIVNETDNGLVMYCYRRSSNLISAVYDESQMKIFVMWLYNILTHIYSIDEHFRIDGAYYEFFTNKYNSSDVNWYITYDQPVSLRKYFSDLVDHTRPNLRDVQVQARVKGAYKANNRIGEWIEFYQDGISAKILRATVYLDNKIHGYRIQYDRNGNQTHEEFYKKGIPCGRHYEYENGVITLIRDYKSDNTFREREYINGRHVSNTGYKLFKQDDPKDFARDIYQYVKNGVSIMYHTNGKKRMECEYKMGKLHGKVEEWYINSSIRRRLNYKNGLKHGIFTEYHYNDNKDETKSVMKFKCKYVNGVRNTPFTFNSM